MQDCGIVSQVTAPNVCSSTLSDSMLCHLHLPHSHRPKTFMISFMIPPFVLSMFSSNAGSCALMMPVALASMQATIKNAKSRGDHEQVKALEWFEKGLYMSIAYSATIGGVATIIATPPNAIVVAKAEENDYPDVTFGQWMGAFMLLALFLEVACFFVMYGTYGRGVKAIDRSFIELEYNKLGRMNRDEKIVGATFFVLVLWLIFESFTTKQLFGICKIDGNAHHNVETHGHCREKGGKWSGTFQNGSITILLGLFLFLIPSVKDPRRNLLSWKNASAGIPWGLLMLLGSGNALSLAFDKTSTTVYLATFLEPLGQASLFWLVTIVVTLVAFITELASNTATTNILLPIFLKFSNVNNRHPLLLAIPCALAASMAFMLPIATPTNAVALGTNKIPFTGFIRAGWKMNVTGIILTIFFVCTLGNWVFEFENVPEGYRTKWACKESNATCPP